MPEPDVLTPPPRGLASKLLRTTAILAIVAFVALLVYGLLAQAPETGIDDSLSQQQAPPAPGFALPVLRAGSPGAVLEATVEDASSDGRVALEELRGTPVVLNFWASWCVPCREEAPVLEQEWRRARGSGVLFVGLNMQDLTDNAREFVRAFDITFLNVRDQRKDVAREWGVTGIPETFFISADGNIVGHVIGTVSSQQLRDGLAAARAGRVLGAKAGGAQLPTR